MDSEKPLPVRQLFLICAVRFAEPISFSIHVPFIYFMVRDFHVGKDTDIGYYVSLITSAFAISQLASAMPIGMISDRIGRRPVVLLGLAVGIISSISFGLSKTYAWALCTKILSGLLDNNIAVLKSMVSELSMGYSETQRARAFSMLQVVFGLGGIVGASLGGYLSEPVRKYPAVFGRGGPITDFLTEFPYFLPCFVASCIATVGWIAGFLLLEETLIRKKESLISQQEDEEGGEEERLLTEEAESGYQTFGANNDQSNLDPKPSSASFRDALTPAVIAVCVTYGLAAYQNVFYDELFPTWSATDRDTGGLGLNSNEIGTALSFAGMVTLFVQFFMYHRLTGWLGTVRLFRASLLLSIFVFGLQGCVRYLHSGDDDGKWLLFAGLLLSIGLKTLCQTVAMTGSIILVNNAAPRMDALGAINAFSQCCSSAMRALGPASSGYIYSSTIAAVWLPFVIRAHLSWILLGCVAAVTFVVSMQLNPAKYLSRRKE
ncbi:major facilitator superfamily domain-containing protein [Zychaea mexicana]|uniref:major facilitator superfamily domain-containing protein n=1 Tax=Zychaea mexicana TaxID=64656 RepID=UPI0022FDF51B|nr:major facilitator superfamily domain-containing protein [Zychaea mexicana]KAI9493707.1 major facilitator superfamily domain-containing protein [Zychaea mexicana]